ncbi:hypothetical protein V1478_007697 [Vespula squamosa]|uniref:Uncharacterized protein n=1 Tax=Vespula squamosa TaxID=30214 RepID=A0ABD2AWN2_VESSQ
MKYKIKLKNFMSSNIDTSINSMNRLNLFFRDKITILTLQSDYISENNNNSNRNSNNFEFSRFVTDMLFLDKGHVD